MDLKYTYHFYCWFQGNKTRYHFYISNHHIGNRTSSCVTIVSKKKELGLNMWKQAKFPPSGLTINVSVSMQFSLKLISTEICAPWTCMILIVKTWVYIRLAKIPHLQVSLPVKPESLEVDLDNLHFKHIYSS